MPNVNMPTGLNPVRYLSGATYNGAFNVYSVPASDATAIGVGDPVRSLGTSSIVNDVTYGDVAYCTVGNYVVGVVVAVAPDTRDSLTYRAASTARLVYVADDPNLVFEVQDLATGTPIAAADIGLNVNLAAAPVVNTFTGKSGAVLDNATKAVTATLDYKIVGFVNRPDNEPGAAGKWLVRVNRHQFGQLALGVA
ncbi:MAG: hypothetical protein ACRCYS_14965 [Beijerinckiaceae bacterium]